MKYLHLKQNYKTKNLEKNNLGNLTMKQIEGTHKQRIRNKKRYKVTWQNEGKKQMMKINHTEMKGISEVEINGLNAAENRVRAKARENYKR